MLFGVSKTFIGLACVLCSTYSQEWGRNLNEGYTREASLLPPKIFSWGVGGHFLNQVAEGNLINN